jgi:sec-independent protein translocase protein TatC
MFAFGIGFQFPILLVFLQLVGILRPEQLRKARRFCIVGIVAVAAVITPSGDPISLATLSLPLYIFFEFSILIGYLATRRKRGWVPRSKRGVSHGI